MKKLFCILLTFCMMLALCPATALAEGSGGDDAMSLWQDSGGGVCCSNISALKSWGNYYELADGGYKLSSDISLANEGSLFQESSFRFDGSVSIDLDSKQVSTTGEVSFWGGEYDSLTLKSGTVVAGALGSGTPSLGDMGNITGNQIIIDGVTVEGGKIGICNGTRFGDSTGDYSYVTMKSGSIKDCNVGIWAPGTLTFSGGTIGTEGKLLPTAILLFGKMNADGGTVYGTVKSRGAIEKSSGEEGATAFYDTVENGADLNDTNGASSGTISAGEYFGTVNNNVVKNENDEFLESTITGGTFHGTVNNNSSGGKQATIGGGDFDSAGIVNNSGLIQNGTFKGTVTNNASGKIEGGTFSGEVTNEASGTISNGTFSGEVTNAGTVEGGMFGGRVTNNGTISGGTFEDEVTNSGSIAGGTFNGKVTNAGAITGGVFYGGINASSSGSISGTKHTVTFDLNGGAGIAPADQVFVGTNTAKAQEPSAEPTKEGCTFTGWYTDLACTQEYNFDDSVTDDITLYAGFRPDFYAVSFDPNGGTLDEASSVAYTTAEGTLALGKLPEPMREGCRFTGWFTEKDGGSKVTPSTTFTQNATLYAHWEESPAVITDNADGTSATVIAKTGDDSHVVFWLALLAVSAAAAALSFARQTGRGRVSRRR